MSIAWWRRFSAPTTHGTGRGAAFVQPANCGTFFLGDYIAVESTNAKAQVLYTGNGPSAMDVFSTQARFPG